MNPQSGNQSYVNKRLDKASRYVSDYWFPVNPALLSKIQDNLKQGVYDSDVPALVSEIRGDFSLFIFCLKNLVEKLREGGAQISEAFNPVESLELAGLEQLKQILAIAEKPISRHSIDSASDFQLARFREAMLSASTAEALSESYAVDSETAFSAALLRQLGFTLIAWNYPSLYQEALNSLQGGEKLDLILAKSLGFSPTLLAMRLLSDWGLHSGVWTSFGLVDPEEEDEAAILGAIGSNIAQICKVGEALARANDPERYPDARDDWEFARGEIETRLGPNGMSLIEERYREHCESYLTYLPQMFNAGLMIEDPGLTAEEAKQSSGSKNPFMALCSSLVQGQLRNLYRDLALNNSSQHNLRVFVRETVPACGFIGGCVYTIDPGMMMLVPQLEIGYARNRSYKAVDYSVVTSDSDIVAIAYQSSEPVVAYRVGEAGQPITAIAGVFGTSQRMGVVLLELPRLITSDQRDPDLVHFKALRHALNDSLSL